MKLGFSNIRDTVDGAVGYVSRIIAGADRVRDALLFSPPGYFHRPMDEDTTTGTTDCVHVEDGSERIILATNNSSAWSRLLDALGRAFDSGETVVTAEDGTNRGYVSWRPNGDIELTVDNGQTGMGALSTTVLLDTSTGNVDITFTGPASGTLRVGGLSVTDYATMFNALKAEVDANSNRYTGHVHTETGAVTSGPQIGPVGGPASIMTLLTNACRSTKCELAP